MTKKNTAPLLSLIIPAHNEEGSIAQTVVAFHTRLKQEKIPHEILVVNDHSTDKTVRIIKQLSGQYSEIKVLSNQLPNGFGFAVRTGLQEFAGAYVAIVMADLSDDPADVVVMYKKIRQGYDCVFGDRFTRGAKVTDYPIHKLILNRMVNNIIRALFAIRYKDATNAFKMYSRETIEGVQPLLSHHFNLLVELPLKSIIRGYSYVVVPTNWTNRTTGISKLKIKEMGSRYFFIILYCWLEKFLSMGDYKKHVRYEKK